MANLQGGVENVTAEAFVVEIVDLIRSHQIHTVTLCYPTEVSETGAAAAQPQPSAVVVEARLESSLNWDGGPVGSECLGGVPTEGSGKVFTFHVLFMSSPTTAELTAADGPEAQATHLGARWCLQLQRRLAICSALTGIPSRLSVSLLPYVPHLSWDRDRDGILGAVHSARMISQITAKDMDDDVIPGAGHVVQAAVLLNASVPLGPRNGEHIMVLVLNAVSGSACFAGPLSLSSSNDARKRRRLSERVRRRPDGDVSQLFSLLTEFSEEYLLPAMSWRALRASPLDDKCGGYDVCGLRREMGCSLYLRGTLDARTVQSITIVVDVPHSLWHRVLSKDEFATPRMRSAKSSFIRLGAKLAETVEAALCRLVAENLDSFVHRAVFPPCEESSMSQTSDCAGGEVAMAMSREIARPILIQCIADSLAHIVRASQNPVFIEEVQRLLRLHIVESDISSHVSGFDSSGVNGMKGDDGILVLNSVDSTAAMLRWAVESRLLKL